MVVCVIEAFNAVVWRESATPAGPRQETYVYCSYCNVLTFYFSGHLGDLNGVAGDQEVDVWQWPAFQGTTHVHLTTPPTHHTPNTPHSQQTTLPTDHTPIPMA